MGQVYFRLNNGNSRNYTNPKKGLLDLLVRKTISAGHMLTFKEASMDPEMVEPNNFAFYFGSFSESAQKAWREAQAILARGYSQDELEALASEIEPRETKGGGRSMQVHYDYETVKQKLITFYRRNGRLPSQVETMGNSDLPAYATLLRYLGPKKGWMDIVNSEPAPGVKMSTDDKATDEKPHLKPNSNSVETDNPVQIKALASSTEEADKTTSTESEANVETRTHQDGKKVTIEMKITFPEREEPILITLTV